MKALHLEINSCGECPYCQYSEVISYTSCMKMDYVHESRYDEITDEKKIKENCPLLCECKGNKYVATSWGYFCCTGCGKKIFIDTDYEDTWLNSQYKREFDETLKKEAQGD